MNNKEIFDEFIENYVSGDNDEFKVPWMISVHPRMYAEARIMKHDDIKFGSATRRSVLKSGIFGYLEGDDKSKDISIMVSHTVDPNSIIMHYPCYIKEFKSKKSKQGDSEINKTVNIKKEKSIKGEIR